MRLGVLRPNPAPMSFDNLIADRESKSRAALACFRFLALNKTFEDSLKFFVENAGALIDNTASNASLAAARMIFTQHDANLASDV